MVELITEDHGDTDPLLFAMTDKLQPWLQPFRDRATQDEPIHIHRVPPRIREGDKSAYDPQVISIGPYHHKDPRLQAMEDHKWRYMHNLLVRRPPYQTDQSQFTTALAGCIKKVKQSAARARGYYSEYSVNLFSIDDFVMMMVLDGCFILELILTSYYGTEEKDDPIHSTPWMLPFVWVDLLKLENQIPFFVLEDLFDIAAGPAVTSLSLKELAIDCFDTQSFTTLNSFEEKQLVDLEVYHLLHLYDVLLDPTAKEDAAGTSIANKPSSSSSVKSIIRKINTSFASCSSCILPIWKKSQPTIVKEPSHTDKSITKKPSSSSFVKSIIRKMNTSFASCSNCILRIWSIWRKSPPTNFKVHHRIPCVVELLGAGIKLRRKLEARSCLDVTFKDGTLDIPRLCVDDDTNPVFRNLVAFEQCCPHNSCHITAYTMFLDSIINTAKDVTILQQCGIIENMLGSEKEVAQLINQLGKGVMYGRHYLRNVFAEVNGYRRSNWQKHRASLVRDYFVSPWKTISVVAAAALLLMTLAQVVFAVLSYLKQ